MSKSKTKEEINSHKNNAINKIEEFIDSLNNSDNDKLRSKSDKLCYWIEDWIRFLSYEESFEPQRLISYNRGEIIKVHLGFNVGSEEGGLHYAVVLDKKNPKKSPVVTIVPLTSVKDGIDINNLKAGSVFWITNYLIV